MQQTKSTPIKEVESGIELLKKIGAEDTAILEYLEKLKPLYPENEWLDCAIWYYTQETSLNKRRV